MRSFIVRVIINGLALAIACWILTGLDISTTGDGTLSIILGYLFIGLIFGLVNAFVKPIVSILSLPITILTLGLFTVVINAAMLYLTSWISSYTTVHFTIDSFFWTAVFAAIIISAGVPRGELPSRTRPLAAPDPGRAPATAGTPREDGRASRRSENLVTVAAPPVPTTAASAAVESRSVLSWLAETSVAPST